MSAAYAVERAVKALGGEAQTIDVLDFTGKSFRAWYRGGYEVLVRKKPKLWGHLYKTSDNPRFNYYFQTALDSVFVRKIKGLLESAQPDWVICTHSLPQPALVKFQRSMKFKVGVVVTDLYPQRMWLRGRPDLFFVPGEWSREILESRYPRAKGRTKVTGIPIDDRFELSDENQKVLIDANWNKTKPNILVTSGGIGGGPMGELVSRLGQIESPIHFSIICGRNELALKAAQISTAHAKPGHTFRIESHVPTETMIELMHSSHLLVAKPGGITTFESMASGLPFLIYDPFLIPGQEEKNAEFLVENGIGIRAPDAEVCARTIEELLNEPQRLAIMRSNALSHSMPNSARLIAEALLNG